MKYMPIDGLSINVSTTQRDVPAPVYGLARCQVTGELIAITPVIRSGAMATGELFAAMHWRSGWQVCGYIDGRESPREVADAVLLEIKKLHAAGHDIAQYFAVQGANNPVPIYPLRAEWFVDPEQIAAFGWRGRVINRFRELSSTNKRLEIRMPWGPPTPIVSESHAIVELEEIEQVYRMGNKRGDWPKLDTVAMLAPWEGSKAEYLEAISRHIGDLYEHMGKMRKALGVIRAIPAGR